MILPATHPNMIHAKEAIYASLADHGDMMAKEAVINAVFKPVRMGLGALGKHVLKPGIGMASRGTRKVLAPTTQGALGLAGRAAASPFRYIARGQGAGGKLNRTMRVAVPGMVAYDAASRGRQWTRAGVYGDPQNLKRLGRQSAATAGRRVPPAPRPMSGVRGMPAPGAYG